MRKPKKMIQPMSTLATALARRGMSFNVEWCRAHGISSYAELTKWCKIQNIETPSYDEVAVILDDCVLESSPINEDAIPVTRFGNDVYEEFDQDHIDEVGMHRINDMITTNAANGLIVEHDGVEFDYDTWVQDVTEVCDLAPDLVELETVILADISQKSAVSPVEIPEETRRPRKSRNKISEPTRD